MGGSTDLIFFTLIDAWLTHAISSFAQGLMTRTMAWVSGVALILVTFWVIIQGYRIVTGQSREPMMAMVTNMARVALIVTAATTMGFFGTGLYGLFTNDLSNEINYVVSGSSNTIPQDIDKNLALTEVAMSAIDAVQLVPGDDATANKASQASFWSGLGTAGPPMTAAVMLLMYQFAIALFIGLGPIFILCLIFEQTKSMFQRWLMYGIATLFSMAILSVVVSMVLKLSIGMAAGMWTAGLIENYAFGHTEGLSHQALEQGGIGMILTFLIVSMPPIAGRFFGETVANGFMHYSAFGGFARPSALGPAGGYSPMQANNQAINSTNTNTTGGFNNSGRVTNAVNTTQPDTIKTQLGRTFVGPQ